jgi:hypothetical protein
LWIDELEKALAHGVLDGGTSTRVFGTILTWMQEKTASCFVVATANAIAALPPEVLRKGRFDEIFFLDLPTVEERKEIFTVHLRKRKRLPQDFDITRLARESEGYVGAELEQAIIDAMYVGFNASREFTTDDISGALRRQVPLSISQRETIARYATGCAKGGRSRHCSRKAAKRSSSSCRCRSTCAGDRQRFPGQRSGTSDPRAVTGMLGEQPGDTPQLFPGLYLAALALQASLDVHRLLAVDFWCRLHPWLTA